MVSRCNIIACRLLVAAFIFSGAMLVILTNASRMSPSVFAGNPQSIAAAARSTVPSSSSSSGPIVIVHNKALQLPSTAVIRSSFGDIVLQLLPHAAPRHVHNFVSLARSGWLRYNGTALYRLEKGFCLQGGGWPKKSGPITVPLETQLYSQHPNKQWAVSAARTSDPDSAGAEFSIMLGDNSKWLGPGGSDAHGYSVFADVIGGKHVVEAIVAQGKVKAQGGLNYLDPAVEIFSIDA